MNQIFIEGTNNRASVAIKFDGQVYNYQCSKGHNQLEEIIFFFKTKVTQYKINLNLINAIGYTSGPGSFTGIRMGMMISQGLGFDDPSKIFPLPSLSALALLAHQQFNIDKFYVARNAFMGEYFFGGFDFSGRLLEKTMNSKLVSLRELSDSLSDNLLVVTPKEELEAIELAISKPCKIYGIELDAKLLLPILDQMAKGECGFIFSADKTSYLRDEEAWDTW